MSLSVLGLSVMQHQIYLSLPARLFQQLIDALHTAEPFFDVGYMTSSWSSLALVATAFWASSPLHNCKSCIIQVMLALEEQQAQLTQDKEQLQQELKDLQSHASSDKDTAVKRNADTAARSQEHAATSAMLASLVKTAQVSCCCCWAGHAQL